MGQPGTHTRGSAGSGSRIELFETRTERAEVEAGRTVPDRGRGEPNPAGTSTLPRHASAQRFHGGSACRTKPAAAHLRDDGMPSMGRLSPCRLPSEPARRRTRPQAHRGAPIRARQRLGRVPADAPRTRTAISRSHAWDDYAAWHLGPDRGRQRRDEGALRVRVRRLPADPPLRRSSPATSARPSGATRRSSSPPTSCSKYLDRKSGLIAASR